MKTVGKTKYRLADYSEKAKIIEFINSNFDMRLPLVNNDALFEYYYHPADSLQFCLAETDGKITAVAGYIRSTENISSIWLSILVAGKGANGAGLGLLNSIRDLTGATLVACNNIRPETTPLYEFLGWTALKMPHYYRVSARDSYSVCIPSDTRRLPISGDMYLREISAEDLFSVGLPAQAYVPQKDLWYIKRRYFEYPFKKYRVYSADDNGVCKAFAVISEVDAFYDEAPDKKYKVLRLVDLIGDETVLPRLGLAFDQLLIESGAEYIDSYNFGIESKLWKMAGFSERIDGDGAVIPNYLTSILKKNTDYFFFTDDPEGFRMFKADGDQDRPNIQ